MLLLVRRIKENQTALLFWRNNGSDTFKGIAMMNTNRQFMQLIIQCIIFAGFGFKRFTAYASVRIFFNMMGNPPRRAGIDFFVISETGLLNAFHIIFDCRRCFFDISFYQSLDTAFGFTCFARLFTAERIQSTTAISIQHIKRFVFLPQLIQ